MELTIKQYTDKRNLETGKKITKSYIHRIVRTFDTKPHLLPDVSKITKKTDQFGVSYYLLKIKSKKV